MLKRGSPCDFATKTWGTAQGYLKCVPPHIGYPVVRRDGRTDGRSRDYYVTTKIYWLDRLPKLLSNGATCARTTVPSTERSALSVALKRFVRKA